MFYTLGGTMANLKDWIYQRKDGAIETTCAWSNINSGTYNLEGVEQMQKLFQQRFQALGFSTQLIPSEQGWKVDSKGQRQSIQYASILHAQLRPTAKKRIVLMAHADTVFPKDHPFQTVKRLANGHLHGPGVADIKGGIVVMLEALAAVEQFNLAPDLGFDIIINPDEETGSLGSASFIHKVAKHAQYGLIVEPALEDGRLAGARGGSGNYSIVLHGRSAHAGRSFHDGRNAVIAAADLAMRLHQLNGNIADTTLNVASIGGGSPFNAVPDLGILNLNIRGRRPEDLQQLDQVIHQLTQQVAQKHEVKSELHGEVHRPAKPWTDDMCELFQLTRSVGNDLDIPVHWHDTGGVCDGNILASCGVPTVDTLGVRGGLIHSPDEFAVTDSFPERILLLSSVISALNQAA